MPIIWSARVVIYTQHRRKEHSSSVWRGDTKKSMHLSCCSRTDFQLAKRGGGCIGGVPEKAFGRRRKKVVSALSHLLMTSWCVCVWQRPSLQLPTLLCQIYCISTHRLLPYYITRDSIWRAAFLCQSKIEQWNRYSPIKPNICSLVLDNKRFQSLFYPKPLIVS